MVDAQNYMCFTIVATDLNKLMQNLQQNETLPRPQHESDVPVACCSHICRRGRMHARLTRCPGLCSHAYHMQAGLNLLTLLPVRWTFKVSRRDHLSQASPFGGPDWTTSQPLGPGPQLGLERTLARNSTTGLPCPGELAGVLPGNNLHVQR